MSKYVWYRCDMDSFDKNGIQASACTHKYQKITKEKGKGTAKLHQCPCSYAGTYLISLRNCIRVIGCDSNHARYASQIASIDANSGDQFHMYPWALPPWIPTRHTVMAFIFIFSILLCFYIMHYDTVDHVWTV